VDSEVRNNPMRNNASSSASWKLVSSPSVGDLRKAGGKVVLRVSFSAEDGSVRLKNAERSEQWQEESGGEVETSKVDSSAALG
jgi:predicted NUDIX family NTP pyrophosphohydrolase